MATDWTRLFAEAAERNKLIAASICPTCGGAWGEGPEGHNEDCPNRQPTRTSGPGRGWRRARGRQRHGDRARRLTQQDELNRTL